MQIKSMFEKPINRNIKGVIKVGQKDEENIFQELDEYVVTDELQKHFREFFNVYNNGITIPTDDIGVWISGFFGSGKSHFLKILSYILNSNLEVENPDKPGDIKRPIDFFKEDNKIPDSKVIADMISSSNISTDVILFNIDTKSENSESEKDKILPVFVKVFNEIRGYATEYPAIAELEKKLEKEGLYDNFKSAFESINGNTWKEGRDEFYFNRDDIVKAIVEIGFMSEESARLWANEVNKTYKISIEKFAEEVAAYCESKGKNHHVVFLVDEIGQYIGEDTNLMLNLQSITEELGSKCDGKAWIIVTSQQNIDSIVNVKGNDFSKIQGRFKTRLSLSSANVDEVIRKRLLLKEQTAFKTLKASYPPLEPILKNNFTFTDSAEMKRYADADEFAHIYPFVPYQFNLLQSALTGIREHGALGKGVGEGERSMLELFQESAKIWMDYEDDILIPFYTFYDPLHEKLDHSHKSVIMKAEKNDNLNEFDVNLLKVLFLIKYVKELKANLDNLTILMISHLDEDIPVLRKKISKSLDRLENETLISKNADVYSFLTNEEQDVNREIKNERVELGEVLNKASDIIFYDIYPEKKFRYNNRYNFGFNKSIDTIDTGMHKNDIGIRIISPYYDFNLQSSPQTTLTADNEDEKIHNALKGLSDEKNEVILYLNKDFTVFKEITEILQIEKYLRIHGTEIKRSLRDAKQEELQDKSSNVVILLEKSLKQSEIFVKGSKVNIVEKNVKDRIDDALNDLISKVYHKLKYMDFAPDKSDILAAIKEQSQETLAQGVSKANNALNDVDNYIKGQSDNFVKPSLKTIVLRFTSAPYGFVDDDVVWLLAKLFSQQRISLIMNSEMISLRTHKPEEIYKFLTGKDYREKVLVEKKKETPEKKLKSARLILKDVFNTVESSTNDETIHDTFIIQANKKLTVIKDCLTYYRGNIRYPGKQVLEDARDLIIDAISIKSIDQFFDFVYKHEHDFTGMGEETYNVIQFFNTQKTYFDDAVKTYKIFESNKNFITDDELITTAGKIQKILNMGNPYSHIKDLPQLCDNFLEEHDKIIATERLTPQNDIKLELDEVMKVLNEDYEYKDELITRYEAKFTNDFDNLNKKLDNATEISVIRGVSYEASNLKIKCLDEITKFKKSKNPDPDPEPEIKSIDLSVKFIASKSNVKIENDEELDVFLNKIRTEVKKRLEDNDVVNLKL